MPRVTIAKILGRTPCPVHRAPINTECPGGGACEARISADQSTARAGRPKGSGRGLDETIALRVTAGAKAGYNSLGEEARGRLQERWRRLLDKAVADGGGRQGRGPK